MHETICGERSGIRRAGAFAILAAAVFAFVFALSAALPATAQALTSSEKNPLEITSLDTEYTIDIDDAGYVYVSFTPDESGYYTIETICDEDTIGYLYDSSMEQIAYDDDSGTGTNSKIAYYFEAGSTYLAFFTFYYDDEWSDTITVVVSAWDPIVLEDTADCIADGDGESVQYVFTPTESGLYEFSISMTSTGSSDVEMSVTTLDDYDYIYSYIYTYGSRTSDSDVEAAYLEAGQIYVVDVYIYDYDDDYVVPSTLTLSVEQVYPTDITSTGYYIAPVTFDGNIYLSYTAPSYGLYEIWFSSDADETFDLTGYVYNSSWSSVGYVYDYGSSLEDQDYMILEAGETYYIVFYPYDSEGVEADFAVTITEAEPTALSTDSSTVLSFTDADLNGWYFEEYAVFVPSVSANYTFTFTSSGTDYYDVYYSIYDPDSIEMDYCYAYASDGSEDVASMVVTLEAGETYYIAITGYYDDTITVTATVEQGGTVLSWDTIRVYGETRYETMLAIVYEAMDYGTCDTVIVASGASYADALAASYAAGLLDCPIVTTKPGTLSDEAAEAIEELGASTVYIVGGTGAVSKSVANEIEALDCVDYVERVSGTNRYETALEIYSVFSSFEGAYGNSVSDTAILAYGGDYPDALCASAVSYAAGYPIFLTKSDSLDSNLSKVLEVNFDNVIIVGGEGVVSAAIEEELEDMGISVTRLAGSNRYETGLEIAEYAVDSGIVSGSTVTVATGTNFPDALVGGVLAARSDGVLLLSYTDELSATRNASLRSYLNSEYGGAANVVYLLGGYSAITYDLEWDIEELGW